MKLSNLIFLFALAAPAMARRSRDDDDEAPRMPSSDVDGMNTPDVDANIPEDSQEQSPLDADAPQDAPLAPEGSAFAPYQMVEAPAALDDESAPLDPADSQALSGDADMDGDEGAAPMQNFAVPQAEDGDSEATVDSAVSQDADGDVLIDGDVNPAVPVLVSTPVDGDDVQPPVQAPQPDFLAPRTQQAETEYEGAMQQTQTAPLASQGRLSGLLGNLLGQNTAGSNGGLSSLLSSFNVLASGGGAQTVQQPNDQMPVQQRTRAGTFNGLLNSVAGMLP